MCIKGSKCNDAQKHTTNMEIAIHVYSTWVGSTWLHSEGPHFRKEKPKCPLEGRKALMSLLFFQMMSQLYTVENMSVWPCKRSHKNLFEIILTSFQHFTHEFVSSHFCVDTFPLCMHELLCIIRQHACGEWDVMEYSHHTYLSICLVIKWEDKAMKERV